ncbi:MAG: Ig-like domain-containing protein, partial [Dehalococcoidia bacterium]
MNTPKFTRLRRLIRERRAPGFAVAVIAAVALIAGVAFVLNRGGGPGTSPSPALAISPRGDEVGRLEPVLVTFEKAPKERDGTSILSLEPAISGAYAWLDDRTLLFQPDYPGYLRGFTYTAHVSAQQDAGLEADFEASFQTAGRLEVVSTIPADGDEGVPAEVQVLVQFSRSVAPLTLLAARDDSPVLEFSPSLAGEGEWLNTSLYRFIPDALAPNTTYDVQIAAGLTSAADGVLAADYVWSFTSFGPALVRVTPDRDTQYAGPRQPVVLEFNQPMDQAAVEEAFSLSLEDTRVDGAFSWSSDGTKATFTPAADLEPLAVYEVDLPAGLSGLHGGKTLYGWTSTFRTVGPLELAETEPPAGATRAQRWGLRLTFSHPVDLDSLEGRVTVSGVPQDEVVFNWGDDLSAYYSVPFEPSTFYTVTIAGGVADRYGQTMPAASFSFTTEPLPSRVSVAVPALYSTYAAGAEPVLYFHASNVETASFTLWPLTKSERAAFTGGRAPDRENWLPSEPPIRRWEERIDGTQDQVIVAATSLTGGGTLPKGDYFLRASPSEWFEGSLAFSVVDTNIVLKTAYDELLAWATDIETGEPVAGARIEVVSGLLRAGESRAAVTDEDGLASFLLQPLTEAAPYADRRLAVVLDDGGRYGIASTDWQQGAVAWSLGLPLEWYPVRYKGHLYTDRPVYRPGETVGIKAIIRDDEDATYSVPEDLENVDLVIRDPQGKQILREAVTLSEHGTFPESLALAEDAATGDYFVSLVWTRDLDRREKTEIYITETSFLVAEFRRPEFEVLLGSPASVYAAGDRVPVEGEARFFFGGALAGARVEWSAFAAPASLRFEEFRGYSFSDYDYWRIMESSGEPFRAQGETVTGEDGSFSFEIPPSPLAIEGPEEYTISATVIDENGQAMAGSVTATVLPADTLAGVRSETWIGVAGEPSDFSLVTLKKEGDRAPNTPVRVEVYQRRWVTTKLEIAGGGRQYRSEPLDELIATLTATTGDDAQASFAFAPARAGTLRFVAVVTDSAGREARAATYLWVAGPQAASWRVSNDDLISLIADKDEYAPGETAEILVPAPFENSIGLVTVERGSI